MAGVIIEREFMFKDSADYSSVEDIRGFLGKSRGGVKFYFFEIYKAQKEPRRNVRRRYLVRELESEMLCAYLETEFNGDKLFLYLNDAYSIESIAIIEMDTDVFMPKIIVDSLADILVKWQAVVKKDKILREKIQEW